MTGDEPMSLHYYCLSFFDVRDNRATYSSAYCGLSAERVAHRDILEAKQAAKVSPTATLLACTYLGYMTEAEFNFGV